LSAEKLLNSLTFVRKKDISSDKKVQLRGSKKRLVGNFLSFLSQLFLYIGMSYIKFNLEIACLLWRCYPMFSMEVLFHNMSLVAVLYFVPNLPSTSPKYLAFHDRVYSSPTWSFMVEFFYPNLCQCSTTETSAQGYTLKPLSSPLYKNYVVATTSDKHQ